MKTFEGTTTVKGADKYVHFTFYFVFTILWYLFLKKETKSAVKARFIVFVSGFAFGLIIEICQSLFTKDRSADITDVVANTSGSIMAILVLWLKDKISKK